jgi:trigger factor
MQVSVESGEGLERRMTVDLPPERFEAEVASRLQKVGRTARLPGFRPGKIPLKILRQRFGEQINHEVFGDLMQSSFSEAVGQQQLRPAGPPRVVPAIDHAGRRYGYTATFEVLPTVPLASIGDRVVKRPVVEVGEADLDAMMERLRQQRKTWAKVERPAQHGDRVIASFKGTANGEPLQGGSTEDRPIEIGAEHLIPGFEDGLIGIAAGETRTLDLSFPENYQAKHLAGKPVHFEVSVTAVEGAVLPELDAELARSYGVEDGDVERFRQDVRGNMERELRQRVQGRVKHQVMDALIAANPIEIPGVLVREEIATLKERTNRNAGPSGMQLPDALFEESARRRVALGLIIAEVVRQAGLAVDAQRVHAAVEELASTYETPKEVVDYYYSSKGNLATIETMVLEDQVVDWVLGNARVEDEPMSFQQLTDADAGR